MTSLCLFIYIPTYALYALLFLVDFSTCATCDDNSWQCLSKTECIPLDVVCDGNVDCGDGSDETFHLCSGPAYTCPEFAFRCTYGGCVSGDSTCNGKSDCADRSDELLPTCDNVITTPNNHSCGNLEFACMDGQCIAGDLRCDGISHCTDGSDETITQCQTLNCPEYAFRCAYGGCVDGDAACNGKKECADGSDEFAPKCKVKGVPPLPGGKPSTTPPKTKPTKKPPSVTQKPPVGGGRKTCKLPPYPEHGQYTSYHCDQGDNSPECTGVEGTVVGLGFNLHYECYNGYSLRGNTDRFCRPGGWAPSEAPICSNICEPLLSTKLQIACFDDKSRFVPCEEPMPSNSFANFQCREATHRELYKPGFSKFVCRDGRWEPPFNDAFCGPACGRSVETFLEPVIYNGAPTLFGTFPWHGLIFMLNEKNKNWEYKCGGSLISHNLMVSAAHCFKYEPKNTKDILLDYPVDKIKISFGKSSIIFNDKNDSFEQTFDIKKVVINDYYSGSIGNYGDDFALVVLDNSVDFTPGVLPVCLDLSNDPEEDKLYDGAMGKVPGFGETEHEKVSQKLLVADMPYVERNKCREQKDIRVFITNDKICGGNLTTKQTVCRGDSGGGYVFEDPKQEVYYLRGVVSLGGGCTGDNYALFTRVSKHSRVIEEYLDAEGNS